MSMFHVSCFDAKIYQQYINIIIIIATTRRRVRDSRVWHINVRVYTLLVRMWHRVPVHTIREEQFNTTLLCKEPSTHSWCVCEHASESGQISICSTTTTAYNAVGSGESCDAGGVCVRACVVKHTCVHHHDVGIGRLVRLHSCLVVIQFTMYKLVCVSAASLHG